MYNDHPWDSKKVAVVQKGGNWAQVGGQFLSSFSGLGNQTCRCGKAVVVRMWLFTQI